MHGYFSRTSICLTYPPSHLVFTRSETPAIQLPGNWSRFWHYFNELLHQNQNRNPGIGTGHGTCAPPDPPVCRWPPVSCVRCRVSGLRSQVSGMQVSGVRSQVSGVRDGRQKTGDRASHGTGTSHAEWAPTMSHFLSRFQNRTGIGTGNGTGGAPGPWMVRWTLGCSLSAYVAKLRPDHTIGHRSVTAVKPGTNGARQSDIRSATPRCSRNPSSHFWHATCFLQLHPPTGQPEDRPRSCCGAVQPPVFNDMRALFLIII